MSTQNILGLLALVGILAAGFVRNRWLIAIAIVYLVAILILLTMAET